MVVSMCASEHVNRRCKTHVLTSDTHIGAVLNERLDGVHVTVLASQCQRCVPIFGFRCTSERANRRCEIHELTSVVHVSTFLDETLDNLSVTIRTGRGQCHVPVIVFRCVSEPADG